MSRESESSKDNHVVSASARVAVSSPPSPNDGDGDDGVGVELCDILRELHDVRRITITTNRILFVVVVALVIISSVIVFVPPCSK